MQSTIYVEMPSGVTIDDLYEQLKVAYQVTFFWLTVLLMLGIYRLNVLSIDLSLSLLRYLFLVLMVGLIKVNLFHGSCSVM